MSKSKVEKKFKYKENDILILKNGLEEKKVQITRVWDDRRLDSIPPTYNIIVIDDSDTSNNVFTVNESDLIEFIE